jgi:hypothetical protein
VAVLSLARDTFEAQQGNCKASDILKTNLSLYVATVSAVFATATSGFDAVRMSGAGVDEDAFRRGWYSKASFLFRANTITIYVASGLFSYGLISFISCSQNLAVVITVGVVYFLQGIIFILSYAIRYWRTRKH